jgi:hypothetical protein
VRATAHWREGRLGLPFEHPVSRVWKGVLAENRLPMSSRSGTCWLTRRHIACYVPDEEQTGSRWLEGPSKFPIGYLDP